MSGNAVGKSKFVGTFYEKTHLGNVKIEFTSSSLKTMGIPSTEIRMTILTLTLVLELVLGYLRMVCVL